MCLIMCCVQKSGSFSSCMLQCILFCIFQYLSGKIMYSIVSYSSILLVFSPILCRYDMGEELINGLFSGIAWNLGVAQS